MSDSTNHAVGFIIGCIWLAGAIAHNNTVLVFAGILTAIIVSGQR